MNHKEMQDLIAQLQAENDALKAKKNPSVSWKISEKGAISIYGLGRFPVTLYFGQLTKLAAVFPQIVAFAEANKESLSVKPTVKVVKAA